jgi:phosphate transport system permease protein
MTAVLQRPPSLFSGRSRRLPAWAPWAILAGVAVASLGLFAVTPMQGRADYVVFVVVAYAVVITAVSAAVEGRRRAKDRLATTLVSVALLLALAPLAAVLSYTVAHGLKRFDTTFFTHSMRNISAKDAGGGAYHAIIGTVEQVGIATLISVPFGLLVSIYLVEYARGRFGRAVSTMVDVMTGLPSIVAGLFILALWVLVLGQGYSGFAGSLALTVLMVPVVIRSTEEILRLVPNALREASYALGVPRWRTIVRIVLPSALAGITTGVMLAIARVTGETAPLLLTVFGNDSIHNDPFSGPQEGLPLFVFSQAGLPNETAVDRAWAGALTLILIVVLLNVAARFLVSRSVLRKTA